MRGQRHAPAALYPRDKTRYPLYGRLGGPQGRSGQARQISPPTSIRSPDRPARSQSLYPLRYPTHTTIRSPDRPARSQSLYPLRYPTHTTIPPPNRPARSQSLYRLRYLAHWQEYTPIKIIFLALFSSLEALAHQMSLLTVKGDCWVIKYPYSRPWRLKENAHAL